MRVEVEPPLPFEPDGLGNEGRVRVTTYLDEGVVQGTPARAPHPDPPGFSHIHFSSKRGDWGTPRHIFDELHREFHFTTDLAATTANRTVEAYLGPDHRDPERRDALQVSWAELPEGEADGLRGFLNPPYGRGVERWIAKVLREKEHGVMTVCLLPARTDTRWFHDLLHAGAEIRFMKGRIKFVGAKDAAPFPSCVVVVRPKRDQTWVAVGKQ